MGIALVVTTITYEKTLEPRRWVRIVRIAKATNNPMHRSRGSAVS
jgi:hypothetical protein